MSSNLPPSLQFDLDAARAAALIAFLLIGCAAPALPSPTHPPTSPPTARPAPTRLTDATPMPTAAPAASPTPAETLPLEVPFQSEGLVAVLGRGVTMQVAISPDGQQLAVGSTLGVYVYRLDTLDEVWSQTTGRSVASLRYSPDGTQLVSGHYFGGLAVWNAADGTPIRTLDTGDQSVVAVSPDGAQVATTSPDTGGLAVLNADTGQTLALVEEEYTVYGAEWSPDGRRLWVVRYRPATFDTEIQVFDLAADDPAGPVFSTPASIADWSPDGTYLALLEAGSLSVRAADGLAEVARWGVSEGLALAWSPDGSALALITPTEDLEGMLLHIWPFNPDGPPPVEPARTLEIAPGSFLHRLAWSPDGATIVVGNDFSGDIWLCDLASGKVTLFDDHMDSTQSVAFSPDGRYLATGTRTAQVNIWEVASGERLRQIQHEQDRVAGVEWSPDGSLLAAEDNDRVLLYDPSTWQVARTLLPVGLEPMHEALEDLAWSPDGAWLAADLFIYSRTHVWETDTGQHLYWVDGDAPAWSPDNGLATSGGDHILLWYPYDGSLLNIIDLADWNASALAWSPDGSSIASESTVWDVESGALRFKLEDEGDAESVAWSPDGRLIATGYFQEDYVIVWDAATGERLLILRGHPWWVNRLDWSPDGKRLAAGAEGGATLVWDIAALLP